MCAAINMVPLSASGSTPGDIASLFNTAFAEYEGVLHFTPEMMAWYLTRPGLGPDHTLLALAGGAPVGGVMLTVAPAVFGGETLPCGIVDSVMTHPEWRRQGIATRLMTEALARMRGLGLDVSLLYTERGSAGYRIYTRLGYTERAVIHYRFADQVPPGRLEAGVRPATPHDADRVRQFLNARLGGRDGYVPVDGALWHWRRAARPASLPCTVLLLEAGDELIATGALCTANVRLRGRLAGLALVTDLAAATPEASERIVLGLLQQVPPGHAVAILAGAHDPLCAALTGRLAGTQLEEVALAAPLTGRGARALQRPPAGWYTLSESLVGI